MFASGRGRGGRRMRRERGWERQSSLVTGSTRHEPTAHKPAYVSIRQHTSACVSIRQHTSAYVSITSHEPTAHVEASVEKFKYVTAPTCGGVSIRQRTSAYVSIRQYTSAYVSIRQRMRKASIYNISINNITSIYNISIYNITNIFLQVLV
jgi:hypothetical protein